ncbi:MAG: hypothetical protein V4538_00620 [Bacteroidota bacterium]
MKLKLIFLSTCILLVSCEKSKFDKIGWNEKGDLGSYPKRKSMLNDLIENHKLKGIKYKELIELLGLPENYSDEEYNTMTYNIEIDYGFDIDPTYSKHLKIELAIDSVVKSYEIVEWKK